MSSLNVTAGLARLFFSTVTRFLHDSKPRIEKVKNGTEEDKHLRSSNGFAARPPTASCSYGFGVGPFLGGRRSRWPTGFDYRFGVVPILVRRRHLGRHFYRAVTLSCRFLLSRLWSRRRAPDVGHAYILADPRTGDQSSDDRRTRAIGSVSTASRFRPKGYLSAKMCSKTAALCLVYVAVFVAVASSEADSPTNVAEFLSKGSLRFRYDRPSAGRTFGHNALKRLSFIFLPVMFTLGGHLDAADGARRHIRQEFGYRGHAAHRGC
ncbi:hypothetical protein EVAR_62396_1 [Eumeta japonica]|uniref:Uncharacterized protein n=1 Tax=Eumeta variegata TaxID=151549 RepID=A0A4C1ZA16_EUMVA|nr:hypothetical protein EVAR_62396_1 [Eumeta japonica]